MRQGAIDTEPLVLDTDKRVGRHHRSRGIRTPVRRHLVRLGAIVGLLAVLVAIGSAVLAGGQNPRPAVRSSRPAGQTALPQKRTLLPTAPASYLGIYVPSAPASYAGVTSFSEATGVTPNLVSYYSGWFEPFQTGFARAVASHGAVPLVQMNPTGVSVTAVAAGQYDSFLTSYARAVRSYRRTIVLGFGHEMNGTWYPWGYRHTPAAVFVAAWRHIVTVFRKVGARNVTWLWTVNTIDLKDGQIPDPAAWWPGSSYVSWVGIDGYFHKRSSQFSSVFGPTVAAVREFTDDPILISETGAGPATGQPAKISSLFAGVRAYGLLGFLWFDTIGNADYRIDTPSAVAALRAGDKSVQH